MQAVSLEWKTARAVSGKSAADNSAKEKRIMDGVTRADGDKDARSQGRTVTVCKCWGQAEDDSGQMEMQQGQEWQTETRRASVVDGIERKCRGG